jgi:TolB-like protein
MTAAAIAHQARIEIAYGCVRDVSIWSRLARMRTFWTLALASIFTAMPHVLRAADKPTVAVLYFDYQGKNEELALLKKGLAQMLISDLSQHDAYVVVERDRLEDVLGELKLNQTKAFDKATANKIGKLLGARFMVMGGYFDVMGTLRVDARVVEVETGRIVRSIGGHGGPEEFLELEGKIARELDGVLSGELPAKTPDPTPGQKDKKQPARPSKLKMGTAVKYSKALDAIDKKDKEAAKKALGDVVKEQPDFKLAEEELLALVQ